MVSTENNWTLPYKEILGVPVYTVYNHPDMVFTKCTTKGKRKYTYANEFLTFDIEVTTISKELAIMYVWQLCYNGEFCIIGRTWEEYLIIYEYINSCLYEFDVLCFVHNLSYEFQFLRGIHSFCSDDVFVIKSRKILTARTGGIEFRCSYILTNLSLDKFTRKYNVEHGKLSGYDYNKKRYPHTALTYDELCYCVDDAIGLAEAIKAQNAIYNDNCNTMPLTQTGYIRREVKAALAPTIDNQRSIFPTLEQYRLLRAAFRGGNTHANRYYAKCLLDNVYSVDIQSSYPAWMVMERFPMTKFEDRSDCDLSYFKDCLKNKACLIKIAIEYVSLKDNGWGFPYIPKSKVDNLRNPVIDNGRILSADYLEMALTDIDYKIISDEYNFKIVRIIALHTSEYKRLPKAFRNVIIKYYELKTKLKGIEGKEVYYNNNKEQLNAGYGMMAQDPLKDLLLYDDSNPEIFVESGKTDDELYHKYCKYGWLPYQWGVWVTAWARWYLERGLKAAGDIAVYCDTDSIKSVVPIDIHAINREVLQKAITYNAVIRDSKGKNRYMGIFSREAVYYRFVTYGAKKYCYETEKGVQVTISGVNKKLGAEELTEGGGIEALKIGFVFSKAGGMEMVYNDIKTTKLNIEGHSITITPNIAALPSTYTLSLSKDYSNLLDQVQTVFFERMFPKD